MFWIPVIMTAPTYHVLLSNLMGYVFSVLQKLSFSWKFLYLSFPIFNFIVLILKCFSKKRKTLDSVLQLEILVLAGIILSASRQESLT